MQTEEGGSARTPQPAVAAGMTREQIRFVIVVLAVVLAFIVGTLLVLGRHLLVPIFAVSAYGSRRSLVIMLAVVGVVALLTRILVVDNEAQGVANDEPVDGWLTIPQAGAAESLNVAMAATVLAFEVARQRRLA